MSRILRRRKNTAPPERTVVGGKLTEAMNTAQLMAKALVMAMTEPDCDNSVATCVRLGSSHSDGTCADCKHLLRVGYG